MVDFNERYIWDPQAPLDESFIDVAKMTAATKIPDEVRTRANRAALTGMRTWYMSTVSTLFKGYPAVNQRMLIENDEWAFHWIMTPFLNSPRLLQAQVDVEMACREKLVDNRLVPAFCSVAQMMSQFHSGGVGFFVKHPTTVQIVVTEIAYNKLLNPFVPYIARRVQEAANKAIAEGQLNA